MKGGSTPKSVIILIIVAEPPSTTPLIQTYMVYNYIFRILCGPIITGWWATYDPMGVVWTPLL